LSWKKKPAGIRAQLLDIETDALEQDFVIQGDSNSTHILNAVSPGWTSSLAFADWIVSNYVLKNS
jgi:L-2-hydroxyglutarate oxidase LhgO